MRLALISGDRPAREACQLLARALEQHRAEVTLITAEPAHGPGAGLTLHPLTAASSDLLHRFDAVGVFLDGEPLQRFREQHHTSSRLRGLVPTPLFTGPVLPLYGDALAADLLPRLGYDLICLQGRGQMEQLDWLVHGSVHGAQAREAIGLWCLPHGCMGSSTSQERLLLVLDQANVPPSPLANRVLYQRLRNVAQASPGWQVRLQPDQDLPAHPDQWPETSLGWHYHNDPTPPTNLQLGHRDDLPLSLIQATACLGVGSPWLLSAMVWGKPTVVLGDYGIRTDFNGPLFFGSGCMQQLANCLPLERLLQTPRPNRDWLADRGWTIGDGAQRLLRRLEALGR